MKPSNSTVMAADESFDLNQEVHRVREDLWKTLARALLISREAVTLRF